MPVWTPYTPEDLRLYQETHLLTSEKYKKKCPGCSLQPPSFPHPQHSTPKFLLHLQEHPRPSLILPAVQTWPPVTSGCSWSWSRSSGGVPLWRHGGNKRTNWETLHKWSRTTLQNTKQYSYHKLDHCCTELQYNRTKLRPTTHPQRQQENEQPQFDSRNSKTERDWLKISKRKNRGLKYPVGWGSKCKEGETANIKRTGKKIVQEVETPPSHFIQGRYL